MEILKKGHHYHIFNRGIDSTIIFESEDNMTYFLKLMNIHLKSKVDILAYCLMNNHFHFIVEILVDEKKASQSFSNLFNAYSKAFNKQNSRTSTLFERPFKRILIKDEDYLKKLILYIHKNPENHGVVSNFSDYVFSSYNSFLSENKNMIISKKDYVLNLFENLENFIHTHNNKDNTQDLSGFENLTGLTKINVKAKFYQYIKDLQDTITSKLEAVDGKAKFREDLWERPDTSTGLNTGGGGGRTRVIENGAVFEKGGVNISAVHGKLPETMQKHFNVKDVDFYACGLSLVLHPKSPMVPTVHANWRYFEMYNEQGDVVDSWFGGGQDLTPYYLFEDDAKHFHQTCKTACDQHNAGFYKKYKTRCDEYFYNSHRNEARGIGGLFFDYCKASNDMSMKNWYNFVTEIGNSFLDAYVPIVEKRKNLPYTEANRTWQEIRRGRYVEFNLVHDKGTLFGLKTNGRIESILMSLPPHVQWVYDHHPEKNSEEEKLIEVLKKPVNWV